MLETIIKLHKLLNKKQKIRIGAIIVLMVISGCLETLGVSIVLPIISIITNPENLIKNYWIQKLINAFHLSDIRTVLVLLLILMILIYIGKNMLAFLQIYAQNRFVYNNQSQTRADLLRKFLDKPYETFLYTESGEVIQLIAQDVMNTFTALSTVMSMASEAIVTVFLVVAIFIINPLMTGIIFFILAGCTLMIGKILHPIMERLGKGEQQAAINMNKWLLQSLEGIKEVKIGHKENFFLYSYMKSGKIYAEVAKKHNVTASIPRLVTETLFFVGMLLFILVMVISGQELTGLLPQLSAFALASIRLLPATNRLNTYLASLAFMKPSIDKVLAALAEQGDERFKVERKDVVSSPLFLQESIRLEAIRYHYPGASKYIFNNVDLEIKVGQSVGIIGVSGGGKTTLIDIVMGLLRPESGSVLIDGMNIENRYAEWLNIIGYIPQTVYMMDDTIIANVALGVAEGETDEAAVWKALEEARMAEHVRSLPKGLYTTIGERGIRLSGGQKQRLGIARALYREPQILIFDEATSALDNETEASIMESINYLQGKKTMIIIAHRLTTIQNCDVVYCVENGKIEQIKDVVK